MEILVFGSNLAGRHGSGSAKLAREQYGAKYGVGIGRTGNSYAIPTKSTTLEVLPLDIIKMGVDRFIIYAKEHPELTFRLVRVGCGLAGYTDEEMAPMFKDVPTNVLVPERWVIYMGDTEEK